MAIMIHAKRHLNAFTFSLLRTQNSELRNLFDIIYVFKCTALLAYYILRYRSNNNNIYLKSSIQTSSIVCHIHVLRHGD